MNTFNYLLLLFMILSCSVHGQNNSQNSKVDTLLRSKLDHVRTYVPSNIDSGLTVLRGLYSEACSTDDVYAELFALRMIAYCNWRRLELDSAIYRFTLVKKHTDKIWANGFSSEEEKKLYDNLTWIVLSSLSDVHSNFNQYDSALYYIKELSQNEALINGDADRMATIALSRALVYYKLGEYKECVKNALLILQLEDKTNNVSRQTVFNANMLLADAYSALSDLGNSNKYYQSTLDFGIKHDMPARNLNPARANYAQFLVQFAASKALGGDGINNNSVQIEKARQLIEQNLANKDINLYSRAMYRNTKAEVLFASKDYREALKYHWLAAKYFDKNGYQKEFGINLLNVALCDLELQNYPEALSNARQGIAIVDSLNETYYVRFGHEVLYKIYEAQGSFKAALNSYKSYTEVKDSLFTKEKLVEIADLEATHTLLQREKELSAEKTEKALVLAQSKAKTRTIWFTILGLGFFILASILLLRALGKNRVINRRLKEQSEIIKENLLEKEALLREVHHRVKNNLQVVSGLLQLQAGQIDDPEVISVLQEGQDRIKSMALIHQKFYEGERLRDISFAEYLNELTDDISATYNVSTEKIKLKVDSEDIRFNIDTSIPLGIIVNELVSNAFKHAFKAKSKGKVTIELKTETENSGQLIVSDDGDGLPENFDLDKTKSMGLKLVKILVGQMKGALNVDTSAGTQFIISFPTVA